jgi:formylglycine-generating enzyme required for sulfatase activity
LQVGTGRAYRFPIDQLYISLTTTGDPARHAADDEASVLEAEKTGLDRRSDVHLQDLLNRTRLVIIGDPGAGKTTFLRRLAYALCQILLKEAAADDPFCRSLPEGEFPVFVRLSDLLRCIQRTPRAADAPGRDDAHAWLPYHLAECSRNEYFRGLSREFFHRRLSEGRCVVMLDGLDEAPDRPTREMLSRLIEHAADQYNRCRFVVTSRPPAYTEGAVLPDFTHARIDPLSDQAVEQFLGRWCGALYSDHPAAADQHCQELLRALELRPEIREMVRNPVMLTALAVVHWNERRLPEQRAELYESIITWLSRSREQRPGRLSAERTVAHLGELALKMQNHPDGRQIQISQHWAAEAIPRLCRPARSGRGGRGVSARRGIGQRHRRRTRGRSAVLALDVPGVLAAKVIASLRDSKREGLLLSGQQPPLYQPEWREVVLLLAGILYGPGPDRVDGLVEAILERLFEVDDMAPEGHPPGESDLAAQARCLGLLGAMLRDLSPFGYQPADKRYERLKKNVMAIFDPAGAGQVPVQIRVSAAEALGRAGDPRPGVGLMPDHHGIPDVLWCDIPAGTLQMGSFAGEEGASKNEYGPGGKPLPVPVAAFRIAAYPVTCAQFRPFVEGDGYTNPAYWTKAGWEWKESEKEAQPYLWDDPRWNIDNHPVVGVSWYEAVAWCRWYTARLRELASWTRPARSACRPKPSGNGPPAVRIGTDIPWGDAWLEDACNYEEAGVEHTTAVGLFPAGAARWFASADTPGCHDLAGNIWEWCGTKWRESYAQPPDEALTACDYACCAVDRFGTTKMPSVAFPAAGAIRGAGATTGVFVASSNSPWILSSVFWILSSESCMLNSDCWFLFSDSWFLRRAAAREFFFGQVCPELPNLSPNLSLNLFLLWSKSGKAD